MRSLKALGAREDRGPTAPPSGGCRQKDLDYVGQWLDECVSVTGAEGDFVPNTALHASYAAWCQQGGTSPQGTRRLTEALRAKGLRGGAPRWCGDRSQRGCSGIRLCG